jgi:hypothetical protein
MCSFIKLNPNCHSSICNRSKLTKPFAANETEPKTHLVMIMNLVFHFSYYELNFNWKTKNDIEALWQEEIDEFCMIGEEGKIHRKK